MKNILTLGHSQTWDLYRDWLRGPYQVRSDAALAFTHEFSEIEARLVRRAGVRAIEITVPFGTRVALRSGPLSQVIWDGTRLQSDQSVHQILRVLLDRPTLWIEVRTAAGDRDWVTYGGSALVQSLWRRIAAGAGALLRARWGIVAALSIHALLVALTWEGFWQRADEIQNVVPIEMAAAPAEPQESSPSQSDSDAFSGSFDRAFSRLDRIAKTSARPAAQARVATGGSGTGWKGLFSGFRAAPVDAPQVRAAKSAGVAPLTSADTEILAELIRRNQERTRGCYERALMQDETLALDVAYEADIVARGAGAHLAPGHYAMKGDGSTAARQTLSRCLDEVLGGAELPARFRGVTLRYQFMFKS